MYFFSILRFSLSLSLSFLGSFYFYLSLRITYFYKSARNRKPLTHVEGLYRKKHKCLLSPQMVN